MKKDSDLSKTFKELHTFDKRKREAERVKEKYPDRVPVICERAKKSKIPFIDKKKYLIPHDLSIGQFMYVIRKRVKISPEKAIFVFVNNGILPPVSDTVLKIYEQYKDEDGFLYFTYSGENTFGL